MQWVDRSTKILKFFSVFQIWTNYSALFFLQKKLLDLLLRCHYFILLITFIDNKLLEPFRLFGQQYWEFCVAPMWHQNFGGHDILPVADSNEHFLGESSISKSGVPSSQYRDMSAISIICLFSFICPTVFYVCTTILSLFDFWKVTFQG